MLAKWDIQELDAIFLSVLVSHFEEFFEIFFWTCIETRSIEWNLESMSEFRGYHHTHIIAVGTLFSSFRSMFDSLDPSEKITDIIGSLDIGDILYLTYLHECLISLIVLRFWLDVRIIPEADNIILITKLDDRHRHIRTTTNMYEDFWFFV